MSACDFKNLNKSDGNRVVANVVSVVATFPVRLRILRVVCDLCILFFYDFMPRNFERTNLKSPICRPSSKKNKIYYNKILVKELT